MKKQALMMELNCTEEELERKLASSQNKALNTSREKEETNSLCSFDKLSKNLPDEGDLLQSEDGSLIRVYEDWKKNDSGDPSRFLFCHAKIDAKATGWYLHSAEYGLKCMISLKSSHRVLNEEKGLSTRTLLVIRRSKSGKSLVCEVME